MPAVRISPLVLLSLLVLWISSSGVRALSPSRGEPSSALLPQTRLRRFVSPGQGELNDGTLLQLWTCNGSWRQKFVLFPHGDASIRLAGAGGQDCVDISTYTEAPDGAKVWMWTCHLDDQGANQKWLQGSGGRFVSQLDRTKCLDLWQGKLLVGASVQVWACQEDRATQQWTFNTTDGSIRPTSDPTLCLDAGTTRTCADPSLRDLPYCNPDLGFAERAADLVARMSVEEKAINLQNNNPGVPRLGVPSLPFAECLHGVLSGCGQAVNGSTGCPTSFPAAIGLGASFNTSLFSTIARTISTEARALNNQGVTGLAFWAPDINPFRDPRWGRGQEVAGEDPLLLSSYVKFYSRGLQEGEDLHYLKVVSTCKHFSGYDLEDWNGVDRLHFDAKISNRDLVDYYWPPFHACVTEAHAQSIMCSYNRVNGIPSCANDFYQNTILRHRWGFDGFIVSDCGAIDVIQNAHNYTQKPGDTVRVALRGGTDLECGSFYDSHMLDALHDGFITEDDITLAITRVYTHLLRLGMLDPDDRVPYRKFGPERVDTPEHRQHALDAAHQSIVLLKNSENTLPLSKHARVAVIGPHGNATDSLLSNYHGTNTVVQDHSPLLAIQRKGVEVVFAKGCEIGGQEESGIPAAVDTAKASDVVLLFLGLDQDQEREGHDRIDLRLPGVQMQLVQAVVATKVPTVVVLVNGGALAIEWIQMHVSAIVEAFYPGEMGGDAIADVLFGDYNPSGKLPITIYPATFVGRNYFDMDLRAEGGITYRYYKGKPLWPFGFGLSYTTFHYEIIHDAVVEANTATLAQGKIVLSYRVRISNAGKVAGDAVVLGFVRSDVEDLLPRKLFDFTRVNLGPGASKEVLLSLSMSALASVDEHGTTLLLPGSYTVEIGDVTAPITTHLSLTGSPYEIDHV